MKSYNVGKHATWILVSLSILLVSGCLKIDHEVSGGVDINPPVEIIEALSPLAAVGATLDPIVQDSFNLYCTPDACITAGDARRAAVVLLGSVAY